MQAAWNSLSTASYCRRWEQKSKSGHELSPKRAFSRDPEELLLELGHVGEVKIAHLHRRYHHIERLFTAGAHRGAHLLHVRKQMQEALVEAKIADTVL